MGNINFSLFIYKKTERKIVMQRKWYSVELPKTDAKLFKAYLKGRGVQYEPSEAFNLIHFECLVNERELQDINKWLLEEVAK